MNILGVLCLTAAFLTVSARHKREWEYLNMKKATREILVPNYRSEISICEKGPGFYRDPNDCHQYIRCVDDFNSGRRLTMFVGRCRPGLVFDENVSSCNWPDLAAPCSNSPEHLRETASKLNNEKQNTQKTVQNNKISDQSNYRDKYESSQQQIVQKPNNPNHLSVQGQKGFQKPEDINLFQEAGTQEKIGQSFDDSEDLLAQERKPQISQGFEEVSKINDQQQTPITQQIREPVVQEKDEPLIQEQVVQQQSEQISPNPDIREPVVEEEPEQISQDEKVQEQTKPHIREPVVQEQTQQVKEKPHIREPVVQEQTQQVKEEPHIREPVVQEQTHQIKENPQIREPVIQEQTKQTSKNKQQTHQDQEVPLWQESDIQEKIYQPIHGQVHAQQPTIQDNRRNSGQQITHQQQNVNNNDLASQFQEQAPSGFFQEIPDEGTRQWVPESQESQNKVKFGLNRQNDKHRGEATLTTLEEPIVCPKEGFFTHPRNCNRFVRCVKNDKGTFSVHFFQCAKHLVFDESISHCTEDNAKCSVRRTKRQVEGTPLECSGEGFFRHPEDCRSFYRCVKQDTGYETHLFSCPANLVFDEEYATCNWPDKAPPCDSRQPFWKPTRAPSSTRPSFKPYERTTAKRQKSTSKPKNDFIETSNPFTPSRIRGTQKPKSTTQSQSRGGQLCSSPGFYRHEEDCTKYYKCVKKENYFVRYELTCPKNFAFQESASRCISQTYVNSCNRKNTPFPPRQDDEESTTESTTSTSESSQSPSEETEIKCTEEGFFRNPNDCNRFYRCVNSGSGEQEFIRYDFKCPESLVFDETNSVCNWPDQSEPCEAGSGGDNNGEKESDNKDESDSTTTVSTDGSESQTEENKPSTSRSTSRPRESSTSRPRGSTTSRPKESTTSRPKESTTSRPKESTSKPGENKNESGEAESDNGCSKEGFFRNKEDCNKFYRCVDFSGEGQEFVRYDFACPEGLVFDESNSVCNWPSEVEACDSESSGGNGENESGTSENEGESESSSTESSEESEKRSTTEEEQTEENTPKPGRSTSRPRERSTSKPRGSSTSKPRESSTSRPRESSTSRPREKALPDLEKAALLGLEKVARPNPREVPPGQTKEFVRYDFSCPEGLVFDESNSVCNWPSEADACDSTSGGSKKDEDENSSTGDEDQKESSTSTTQRGRGSTTEKQKKTTTASPRKTTTTGPRKTTTTGPRKSTTTGPRKTTTTKPRKTTTSRPGTTSSDKKPTEVSEDENPPSSTRTETPESTPTTESSSTSSKPGSRRGSSSGECKEAGFFRNPDDCNKFYRCVDYNGDGEEFVKYDFSCPEGLVFDEENSVCNWPEQSAPCEGGDSGKDGESTNSEETESSTTSTTRRRGGETSTSSTTQKRKEESTTSSTTRRREDERSTTQQTTESSSDLTTKKTQSTSPSRTTTPTTEESSGSTTESKKESTESSKGGENSECNEEGFFRNPDDCGKFYRCVDFNGDGQEFVRYDFDCPDGLYFDQANSVCNWPEQSPACETGTGTSGEEKKTTDGSSTTSKAETTSTTASRESTSTAQSTTKSSEPTSTSSSTISGEESNCSEPGFFRCQDDCSKFYRCVDETGDGQQFTRYDFKCPEGLLFDDKNKRCDFPSDELSCDNDSTPSSTQSTTSGSSQTTTSTYTTTSEKTTSSGTTKSSTKSSKECTEEGYFRDPEDCRKYYRCIDEGDGTLTREEFSCAEDEVFDEEMRYCNRKDLAPPCDEESTSSSQKTTSDGSSTTSKDSYETTSSSTTPSESTTTENKQSDCSKEGFFRCKDDCSKFYRCVDEAGDGQLTRYDFKCPDGLLFDDKNKRCDFPSDELSCDNDSTLSSTQSTTSGSSQTTTSTYTTSSGKTTSRGTTESSTKSSTECTEEGYFRDPEDCRKYYRCIDEGDGTLTRQEFSCAEDEVFDEEMRYCNRKDLAPPCDEESTSSSQKTTSGGSSTTSKDSYETTSSSTTSGESTTNENKESDCTREGFFRCKEACNQFYRCVDEEGTGENYKRYNFTCPEGLIFDENNEKCDWPSEELTCEEGSSTTSSGTTSAGQTSSTTSSGTTSTGETSSTTSSGTTSSSGSTAAGECTEEGYFRNPEDCSKYYRCIDEGDGTLTREDFSCAEDEVFDDEMNYCNRKDLAPPCEDSSSTTKSGTTSTQPGSSKTTESTSSSGTTSQSTSSTTESSASTTEGSTDGTTKSEKESSSGECQEEGFHRDPNDCNKFYRCVDFKGDGKSFTKYDFECPEGLVFDETNDVCNWPSSVPSCESSDKTSTSDDRDSSSTKDDRSTTQNGRSTASTTQENTSTTQEDTSTTKADSSSSTATTSSSSTTSRDTDNTESSSSSTPSSGSTTQESDNKDSKDTQCTEEGFFRNPDDCTKFYRCVDFAGTGESYVRYDFECPDDLVFDEENNVCNWPNMSPGCESRSKSNKNESKSTTEGETSTTESTTRSETSEATTSEDKTSTTSGTNTASEGSTTTTSGTGTTSPGTSTTRQSTSSTSSETDSDDFQCEDEGFFRHPKDCKKYYECKRDEDTGELVRIDCECPEGLVFDEDGWYCNAEELSPPCDGNSFKCEEEGFFRDPEDCTKYYRCNRTESGFRRERFQCQDGNVFDEEGRYCNAPELSEPCNGTSSTSSSSGTTPITDQSTTPGSGTSSKPTTSTSSEISSTSGSSTSSGESGECTEEGFFRNPEDCAEYYQCVRNEDTGEFDRTDHTCQDGRIFDESVSYCNDPELSEEPCDSESTTSSSTRGQTSTTESSNTSTGGSTNEQASTTESSSTTNAESTSATSKPDQGNRRGGGGDPECTQEGFFRHPKDCNKFYRCVDFSGSGESFVRYDFDCPDGLHFDEVNSVCNWPTMTPKCTSESE
ncbi:hypothetical protein CDAR_171171 [Caerostris darwini]|uniref:Chitin-binding type-2 domain-containing protein n=1 Tax=Caerostris darwini TaxID=1538125 RepID=A0AAV4WLA6_9ARAC|nr:hypothetical protein CDAR_171171 [Caerostris darwini]